MKNATFKKILLPNVHFFYMHPWLNFYYPESEKRREILSLLKNYYKSNTVIHAS